MKDTTLVNELGQSSLTGEPGYFGTTKKIVIEFIAWLFGIILSLVALTLVPISIRLGGGNVNILESVIYKSELYFIGITITAPLVLEYDRNNIFDAIITLLNILLIILGAFVYSLSVSNEYNQIISALTTARTVEEAELLYQKMMNSGKFCYIYLLLMLFLGLIKYIQKVIMSRRA